MKLAALILSACAGCAQSRPKGGLVPHPELSPDRIAPTGRRFALVIGVDRPVDSSWPALKYARKDARDLATVLGEPGSARFEVETLAGASATGSDVRAALERLAQHNASPDDVVVVYFSGHGTLARRPGERELARFLVASDTTRRDVSGTGLDVDVLRSTFAALKSRRKVLILAACYSGGGKSLLPEEVERELAGLKGPPPLSRVSRAVTTLSAAAWGQAAREDDALQNDIYTHFFIEAIAQRLDRNHDGAVSVEEAHDHARDRTYAYTGGQQVPTLESEVMGSDPIILAGEVSALGLPELGTYDEDLTGSEVSVDGHRLGALPGSVAVAAGRHTVSVLKGDASLGQATLTLELGDRVDVSTLLRPRTTTAVLSLRAGYHSLLDAKLRQDVGGPMPLGNIEVRFPSLFARRFDVSADIAFGTGPNSIAPDGVPVPVHIAMAELGAGVQYTLALGRLTAGIGPRLSLMYLRRSYDLAGTRRADEALLTVPGVSVDLRFWVWERWEWGVAGRLSYAALSVDGNTLNLGAGSIWTGLGYRFP